jgi:outer membrane protein OmpA-like peptidoglycan-associated protein
MTHARFVAVVSSVATASVFAACAGRRVAEPVAQRPALIVLLPDPETAAIGGARVTNEYGSVDLAAPRNATVVTSDRSPTPVTTIDESEVTRIFESALAALPPVPRHFTLHFRFESDELTEQSRALVPEILKAVDAMPFPEVAVIGHTDTLGDARANVVLGLKRASMVRGFLERAGVEPAMIDTSSHGEQDPLIKTPNNTPEPRNRRVEIVVR